MAPKCHDLVLEKHLTAACDRHIWEWGSRSSPWTRRAWDAPCEEPKSSVQHSRCALVLQRVLETKKCKMYLHWSNVKVTLVQFPSGLISSSPCFNVRLAKHPSFSQTQGSLPCQTQLSINIHEFWLSHPTFGPQPCHAASSVPRAQGKSLPVLHMCVPEALMSPETCLARLLCPSPSQKEEWILKGKMSAHTHRGILAQPPCL